MLNLTFDPSFDQGYWPGPLADKKATTGEMWVGPLGFLNVIETMTGLRGPGIPPVLRAASLVPEIRSRTGFWTDSAKVDPLGTATRLLQWRDYLCLHGWQGQECSERLRQLSRVTRDVLPGIPDRLLALKKYIGSAGNTVSSLTLLQPLDELPHCWREVILALKNSGTEVINREITPSKAGGDLAASRKKGFELQFDGSLQMLRPQTPTQAAHETAAWLSGLDNLESTVIIGPDSSLDEALHRFGLPCTGAGIQVYDNSLLQILPLVLEMAWNPPDPQRALELLILPVSPVPKNIALRLAGALHKHPAVGSKEWQNKMHEGLESIEDPDRRNRVQARVQAVFGASISQGDYPASEITARIDLIRDWARGRMELGADDLNWHPLIAQLENARRLVDISGLQSFTAPQIKRMIHDLNQESSQIPLFPDQAGLAYVSSPECLAGSAKNVVWWSFNHDCVPPVYQDPFSQTEKDALSRAGVVLPDPGQQAEHIARRWQRPLMLAENTLLLVCPESSSSGEEQFPHPVWDELVGRMKDDKQASGLQNREIMSGTMPARFSRKAVALPAPRPLWTIHKTGLISKRSKESANSLSSLLSCPLQWVISYQGRISSGLSAALAEPEELEGWFVHEIVSIFLKRFRHDPGISIDEVERIFDEQGPRLAARFFLPGFDHLRARVRNTTKAAVEQILQMISQGGFDIRHVEDHLEQVVTGLDLTLDGTPDLVLDSPLAVVDFKRGGMGFRQKELANGASVQLAVYSRLLCQDNDKEMPPAAYYMLLKGQLITAYPDIFPDSMAVKGPALEETWEAAVNSYDETWEELEQGKVMAPGNDEEPPKDSAIVDGRLQLAPCAFCGLGNLCGRAFAEE